MRYAFLICALLGVSACPDPLSFSALADENDLSYGVFIAHNPPNLLFSSDPPPQGWCQHYVDGYSITSCAEQNARIDVTTGSVWFVLAAWCEDKEWCGIQFGFGNYDPAIFDFVAWEPCGPGGMLELPTEGWPGPNEGTAFVAIESHWTGNFTPVYYFVGYAYPEGMIPFGPNPTTGVAGFGNCLIPSGEWDADCLPGMGIFMDGIECCPSEPSPVSNTTWGGMKRLYR